MSISRCVEIQLDRPRRVKLDLNAMVEFEEATGKSLLNADAMQNLTAKDIRALLWAALLHEDPTLTVQQVGGLIDPGNLGEITERLRETWNDAMPEAREDASADPLTANRSAG